MSETDEDLVPLRLGTSACLQGEAVRFDGSHKRDRFLTDVLGRHVSWVKVCPEVGAGMGVPRPTLRLIGTPAATRLVVGKDGEDWTERMETYARELMPGLQAQELCGFVLKSASPSCGMERVKLYDHRQVPQKQGVGIFARVLMEHFPMLPIEEEGRLHAPLLRETFLDAVFAYRRWRSFCRGELCARSLIVFHRRNKFLLRAHSPASAASLGRLVAGYRSQEPAVAIAAYGALYMRALKERATPGRHAATMRYIAGRLRHQLSAGAREMLHEVIDDYRAGYTVRAVPLALLRHHALEHNVTYLSEQFYLAPFPKDLRHPGG
jgi:uncharacterized protein YbbK (DUF523 family)/uncharacterized protein YbgA (DUF1722 family)